MPENDRPAGHPMSEIAERFEAAAKPFSTQPEHENLERSDSDPVARSMASPQPSPSNDPLGLEPLLLRADQIEAPAFFVDRDLFVRWMAAGSDDDFSQALSRELEPPSDRNIFSLLLKPAVKDSIQDWQSLFSFVYVTLRRSTSRNTFASRTDFIAEEHLFPVGKEAGLEPGVHRFQVASRIIGPLPGVVPSATRIFSLEFPEGTLFLLRKDLWAEKDIETGPAEPPDSPIAAYDSKETICILSARLDDSRRIADTMLAEVFFKMMNRVWKETDDVATSLGGVRAGCNGAQIQYVFKATAGRNPIFSAIWCATRMNRQMQMLQAKLKTEHGWADELCMNMGISHGESDSSIQDPDSFVEFMIPGGALDQSGRLASIAAKGEIWITKNAVSQLPKPLMAQVVLGIEREGEFMRNFFTRICDLPEKRIPDPSHAEMGNLSVTRILNIEKSASSKE